MKLDKLYLLFPLAIFLFTACHKDRIADLERPHAPWAFRSVLDSMPRMATAALHEDLWVAYHTETGALYKAWQGSVNFDGAVYTTAHGPQPSTLGDAWFVNRFKTPWLLGGQPVEVQYRGHRFEGGQVFFKYELAAGGKKATVTERPEFVQDASGQIGLERTFRARAATWGSASRPTNA